MTTKRRTPILRPIPSNIYTTISNTPVECLSSTRLRSPSRRHKCSIRYPDGFIIHNLYLPLYRATTTQRLHYYRLAYLHLRDNSALDTP